MLSADNNLTQLKTESRLFSSALAAAFPDITMNTSLNQADKPIQNNSIPQKLSLGSKLNAFWVCLLIITQIAAVAFATDWAIITLIHLPLALAVVLTLITAAAAIYGSWFAIRAAIQSERQYCGEI